MQIHSDRSRTLLTITHTWKRHSKLTSIVFGPQRNSILTRQNATTWKFAELSEYSLVQIKTLLFYVVFHSFNPVDLTLQKHVLLYLFDLSTTSVFLHINHRKSNHHKSPTLMSPEKDRHSLVDTQWYKCALDWLCRYRDTTKLWAKRHSYSYEAHVHGSRVQNPKFDILLALVEVHRLIGFPIMMIMVMIMPLDLA